MIEFITLTGDNDRAWDQVVEESCFSDFFHLAAYHRVFAEYDHAWAELVVFRDAGVVIALPLLIRPVPAVGNGGADLFDATSVYGYAGPLCSRPIAEIPAAVIARFQAALQRALTDRRIVSLFSRLHPLADQAPLVAGLGSGAQTVGETVSIDLTLSPEQQWRGMRRNHRDDIRKALAAGVYCMEDSKLEKIDLFAEMYEKEMMRLDADPWYRFRIPFFINLRHNLASKISLFFCYHDNKVIAAILATLFRGVIHSFLSSRDHGAGINATSKVTFDSVRRWGLAKGAHTLFLGGGVGGREDSLLHFKQGFSDRRHSFAVWRWVIMADAYRALSDAQPPRPEVTDAAAFFPAYRAHQHRRPRPVDSGEMVG